MKKVMLIFMMIIFAILSGCSSQEGVSNQSIDMAKISSIVSNNNRNHLTSETVDYIYYTDSFSVKKISKEDNDVESIYEVEDLTEQIYELECFADKLYLLTSSFKLLAMSTDGLILKEVQLLDIASSSFYTYDGGLYLIASDANSVYKLNIEDLTLEEADTAIIDQYVATDGTTFVKKLENDLGKVYVLSEGKETLFSGENESVILNRMNFTDSYVFYYAFNMEGVEDFSSLNSFSLYRVDLNGENKKLIREVELYDNSGNIRYDNEYIYVSISAEEYLKIHKETFEETNIIDDINEFGSGYEISDGRFFDFASTSFWDSETGEVIDL